MDAYKQKAAQEYDPQYNQQVNNLKSALANQMAAYDKQTTTTNQAYDTEVKDQNLNNYLTKNNYSNNTLGRGMARSSITTSGLAGLDDKNTRLVGDINSKRTSALGNIANDRANYNANYNMQINQLSADRESQIAALARQLYDSDWQKDYQNRQLAQEAAIAAANRAAYSSGGSGYGSSGDMSAEEKSYIDSLYNSGRTWGATPEEAYANKRAALAGLAENTDYSYAARQYAENYLGRYDTWVAQQKAKDAAVKTTSGSGGGTTYGNGGGAAYDWLKNYK